MKLISVYFARKKQYKKFLKVFINSAKKVMPKIKPEIINLKMPEYIDHKRDTAIAFLAAAQYALKSKKCLAIADIDLMFIRSITDIFDINFDIAITTRSKMKYNTGLWFYRPSFASNEFVKKWILYTKQLMKTFAANEDFIWSYGGIDQAALYLTIKKDKKTNVIELPCQEWNATQTEWPIIDKYTRVIHVKSKLRLAAIGRIDITDKMEYMKPIIKKWNSYL